MTTDATLKLSDMLGAMSHALDMTEGLPAGHSARAAWVAIQLADRLGLSVQDRRDLYYATLLKDAGCSSNAARVCEIYRADDIALKRDFRSVGPTMKDTLRFVIAHTAPDRNFAVRAGAVLKIMRNADALVSELVETRCQRGADIVRRLRFPETVAGAIASLDEHWDGGGKPQGLKGDNIPLFARIALLAQIAEVFHAGGGRETARAEVARRSGSWFDPLLVAAFLDISADADAWSAIDADGADRAANSVQGTETLHVDENYLDDLAQAFADVVDAKTPFTGGHSERFADVAELIAAELGFDREYRRRLRRAALLHDIGKLGVSNKVLDKPDRLDEGEWTAVRTHPTRSEEILSRLPVFAAAAVIGGAHHERLVGKGYPRGLHAADINLDTRIVTVADVFDALTAERPYRAAMPVDAAMAILEAGIGQAFDAACVAALARAIGWTAETQAAA